MVITETEALSVSERVEEILQTSSPWHYHKCQHAQSGLTPHKFTKQPKVQRQSTLPTIQDTAESLSEDSESASFLSESSSRSKTDGKFRRHNSMTSELFEKSRLRLNSISFIKTLMDGQLKNKNCLCSNNSNVNNNKVCFFTTVRVGGGF